LQLKAKVKVRGRAGGFDPFAIPFRSTFTRESAETGRRWLTVLGQLKNGEMPPEDELQPSHEQRARLIAVIIEQFWLAGNPIERLRSTPSTAIS